MRLIDADKMQEWAFQFNFEGRITERELYLFNRAIEEMPTVDASSTIGLQNQYKWIPCSLRLPTWEEKTYWVYLDCGHMCECRWTDANPFWTHIKTEWHWNYFDIPQYTKVVAWMELPEPYKEEQDETN